MRGTVLTFVFGFLIFCLITPAFTAAGGPAGKVSDLIWMTGHWEGALRDAGTFLEENWARPKAGTIASLVRSTKGDTTTTMELLVIEEVEGSLVLHLQQWGPGYQPRPEGPVVMKLVEIGKNKVVFEAVGESALRKLGYRREGKNFIISVTNSQGQFDVPLMGK
jgi:hypothetical protein